MNFSYAQVIRGTAPLTCRSFQLNMKSIAGVGSDIEYTLAQYKPYTFESMAYASTTQKVVNNLGYPKDVSSSYPLLDLAIFFLHKSVIIKLSHYICVVHAFTFVVRASSLSFFCPLVSHSMVAFKDVFVNVQKPL